MATTKNNKIGKTRIKLCKMLNDTFPQWHFEPEDINSQFPIYASVKFDCCSWAGYGTVGRQEWITDRKIMIKICSWSTMTECVRYGFNYTIDNFDVEIFSKKQ